MASWAMTADVAAIVSRLASTLDDSCDSGCRTALDNAIITAPDQIAPNVWERLGPLTERYRGSNPRA